MAELREMSLRFDTIVPFLEEAGLRLEPDLTDCRGLYEGDNLIAFGALAGHTIKCLAVREDRRGEALLNILVSHLYTLTRQRGAENVFVFTKPENIPLFESLSFSLAARAEMAALLESDRNALPRYLDRLKAESPERGAAPVAAVVMNANPFTLGHRHLLREAAKEAGTLHIFVVEEENSAFPSAHRLALVRAGCADIPNAVIHSGGPYIISAATFPSYFIKDPAGAAPAHAALDVTLFATRIAPALGITLRLCGEEPLDPLTRLYNETLANILPAHGVNFSAIPRKKSEGEPISASRVRALIAAGNINGTRELLPDATWDYLHSPDGQAVCAKLREGKA